MNTKIIKRVPLYAEHQKLNARFTEFGGWDMPVQYTSIIDEHNAVRQQAGIFDTSHMGIFSISGSGSTDFLNKVTVSNIPKLVEGQAKYSFFLNEDGGIIDDIIIYKRENDYILVVNAGNIDKDFNWLKSNLTTDVNLENLSDDICLFALQGPASEKILQPFVKNNLKEVKYFNFITPVFNDSFNSKFSMLARTGYTGEDGFEIFISNEAAKAIWTKLMSAGVKPCGLGCRDTLRLEACMPLHGHEINDDITPLEAELDWVIYWDKEFIGKQALLDQKKKGIKLYLTAFITDSGIPRSHCDILIENEKVGTVTSGSFSPTLKKGIGLGYINSKHEVGETLIVNIHGQPKTAKIVKKPFYKRNR